MKNNVPQKPDKRQNKETIPAVYRILITLMLCFGLLIVAYATEMNIIFEIIAFIAIIWGSICSPSSYGKWIYIALISISSIILLFICNFCNMSSLNLKAVALYVALILQIIHFFNCTKKDNLKVAIILSIILTGLSVNIRPHGNWGVLLSLYLIIMMIVYFYETLLARGYVLYKYKDLLKDYDFKGLTAIITSIFVLSLLIFCFVPKIEFKADSGFIVSTDFEFDGNIHVKPKKKSAGKNGAKGNNKPDSSGDNSNNKSDSPGDNGKNNDEYNGEIDITNKNNGEQQNIVLFKVKTDHPQYLREIAYDNYTGKGWKINKPEEVKYIEPTIDSYYKVNSIKEIPRQEYESIVQKIEVEKQQSNLIISSYIPMGIYFPKKLKVIMKDSNDCLRSPIIMNKGFQYTSVVAFPVLPSETMLLQDKEKEKTYKKDYQKRFFRYLKLPDTMTKRTRELAYKITKNAKNDYDKVNRIKTYLSLEYKYNKSPKYTDKSVDVVDHFLFESKQGYNEEYSSSLAVMLRSVGIPSRLVQGYTPGTYNPFTDFYEVRNRNMITWVEAYIPNYGWVSFHQESLQHTSPSILLLLLMYLLNLLLDIPFLIPIILFLEFVFSLIIKYYVYIFIALGELIVALTLIYFILMYLRMIDTSHLKEETRLYLKLCKKLKGYGFKRSDNETALVFLNRIKSCKESDYPKFKQPIGPETINRIKDATNLYLDIRFGKKEEKLSQLKDTVDEVLKNI